MMIRNKTVVCFIIFFLSIFGPKIKTYIDVSAIANVFALLLVVGKRGRIGIKKYAWSLLITLVVLILYSLLLSFFVRTIDILFLFKLFRAFLAIACISIFIDNQELKNYELINILEKVLLIHALAIIISSTVWVELQNILKPISGFDRHPTLFRSTGFTNGYDFAGLLCCFGILIVFYIRSIRHRTVDLILFIFASFMTSRISMLVTEGMIIFLVIKNNEHERINKAVLRTVFILSVIPVLGLFLFSTNNFNNIIVQSLLKNRYFAEVSGKIVNYYATTNIGNTLSMHYDFSGLSISEFLLGSMQQANQDPGYTQYIYNVGIVGLLITISFYCKIIMAVYKERKWNKQLSTIVIFIAILCLILSVKNSYLLARHVTETMIIILSILQREITELKFERRKTINDQRSGIRNCADIQC